MDTTSFLDKIAQRVFADFPESFENLTLVLPNKRARVFLIEKLKSKTDKTFFAPKIISIEEFIYDISKIKAIDNIELLFCFYQVYKKLTPTENTQDFETFSNWAKMLIGDFNEIDRYLLNPEPCSHGTRVRRHTALLLRQLFYLPQFLKYL